MNDGWTLRTPVARFITSKELSQSPENESEDASSVNRIKSEAQTHFDTVAIHITNEKWRERWKSMCVSQVENVLGGLERDEEDELMTDEEKEKEEKAERWRACPSLLREECTMIGLDEAAGVIGIVSPWLELDSPDDWVRHDCEIALKQELAYASYLNLTTVILPPPVERSHVPSYARAVRSFLDSSHFMQLVIRIPLYDPSFLNPARKSSASGTSPSPVIPGPDVLNNMLNPGLGIGSTPASPSIEVSGNSLMGGKKIAAPRLHSSDLSSTWEMWDTIRAICGYSPRLTLALDLSLPLPSTHEMLSRWFAEPVSHVFLPASTFIPNAKGYPVLPKGTQVFLQNLMRNHPTIILSGTASRLHPRGTEDKYVDYVRYLEKSAPHVKRAKEPNSIENYAQGYQDYLQMPLQPLQDHLASMVYENFERDPVKYQRYEEAVFAALSDRPKDQRIVLTVAGAGRGPLVARSLKAIERSSRNVFVYAIEKNPNAYVTLQQRKQGEWKDKVEVLFGDMRHLHVPGKADILVSELLGSFGDNELSPECLDGAMRFLKDDGISIPSSYSAFLAPIQSAKLHHEAGGSKDSREKDREKGLETPYVVMLQAINFLGGDHPSPAHGGRCGGRIQQCWEFVHPRRDALLDDRGLPLTNSHNTRSASLTFAIPHAGILHGFAGYFEAVLYGNIGLSIHPDRMDLISKDMLSWFPYFFPIKEPLYLPADSELRVDLWRLTGSNKVWYEWYAEAFLPVQPASVSSSAAAASALPGSAGSVLSALSGSGHAFGNMPRSASPSPRVNGSGTLTLVAPPTPTSTRSPLVDAVDLSFSSDRSASPERDESGTSVVKIGQTSLHNPGGRSSWYGL